MPDRSVWAGRKIAGVVAVGVASLGIAVGAGVSQAATVPPYTPARAVVVMGNFQTGKITDYKLADVDPFTGKYGVYPVGDGEVYDVHWTNVTVNMAWGTARYDWGKMGSYRSGPVNIAVAGSRGDPYHYTAINLTLTQSWYGFTNGPYPPYGHGAHHTFASIVIAANDPTTNFDKF
jgi:hypothetical protein